MKKCPFCAEEIQDEAIVCHYCGSELETQLSPGDRKKCQYCAEWIQVEAVVCRYCGQDLVAKDKPVLKAEEPIVSPTPLEKVASTRPWYRQTWFYICTIFFAPLFILLALTDKKPPYWVRIVFWIILIIWILLCLLLSGILTDSFFPNLGPINEIFSNLSANIPVRSNDAASTPLPGGKPTFSIFNTVTPIKPQPTYTMQSWKPSQTPKKIECVQWDEVNKNDVGKELCVYGTWWQLINFRMERNPDIPPEFDLGEMSVLLERDYMDTTFLFYHAYFSGSTCWHTSDCVMGTGIIQEMNGILFQEMKEILFIDMNGENLSCCE